MVLLLILCGVLHFFGNNENRIESVYSRQFYQVISFLFRSLFGKLPFSAGDVLYGVGAVWLCWKIVSFVKKTIGLKKQHQPLGLRSALISVVTFLCVLYLSFNVLWGLNYNRKGIAWQLGLNLQPYNKSDMVALNALLVMRVNQSNKSLLQKQVTYPDQKKLFKKVSVAYQSASLTFPFLTYHPVSLKSSLWSNLLNYSGVTGYYNPFTAEAQVNTSVPSFLQPYIACHEVAHQLGYAKEMEANFVGYLSALSSPDSLFHYAAYLELFMYANRNLYAMDSVSAKHYRYQLSLPVRKDIRAWILFNKNHESVLEPITRWIYEKYLFGNKQPQGVLSYDEVSGFLIAYLKKNGTI